MIPVSKDCCCELGPECPHAQHWCSVPELPMGTDGRLLAEALERRQDAIAASITVHWTCPDCSRKWETYRVDLDPRTPEPVLRRFGGPSLGWRTVPGNVPGEGSSEEWRDVPEARDPRRGLDDHA